MDVRSQCLWPLTFEYQSLISQNESLCQIWRFDWRQLFPAQKHQKYVWAVISWSVSRGDAYPPQLRSPLYERQRGGLTRVYLAAAHVRPVILSPFSWKQCTETSLREIQGTCSQSVTCPGCHDLVFFSIRVMNFKLFVTGGSSSSYLNFLFSRWRVRSKTRRT